MDGGGVGGGRERGREAMMADLQEDIGTIQIMDGNSTALSTLLANIDYRRPLTHSLATLQHTLQKQRISSTSQLGLQAYQLICQEYINIAQRRVNPNTVHRHSSRHISVADLIKPDPPAAASPDKNQALMVVVKRHHFRRLMQLASMDDDSIRRDDERKRKALRMEMARFHYKMKIWRKLLLGVEELQAEQRVLQQKADGFAATKKESILQEYFLAWRDEALMSEEQRAYRQELEDKWEQLGKIIFVRRLAMVKRDKVVQQLRYDEQTQSLENYIKNNRILSLFSSLSTRLKDKFTHLGQGKHLSLMRKRQIFANLIHTIKKIMTYRTISDERRLSTITKTLFPRLLLKKMKSSLQLRKVYFKNEKKIIFLAMLLNEIKEGLERKGYDYPWMNQLPSTLQFTDSKLAYPYRKYTLAKVFNQFRDRLQREKQQTQSIKLSKGDSIIKQLLYNYKLSIIKQKQQHKVATLQTVLADSMASRVFIALGQTHSHRQRQLQLCNFLDVGRSQQAIRFLRIYHQTSSYYNSKVQSFKEKYTKNHLKIIFRFLKTILLTERVNKRLVQQFQNYTNRLKTQRIFQCLKDYCFSEQLIKRRQRNVTRIRLSRYADQLFYNLKVDLYGHAKSRVLAYDRNEKKVRHLRIRNAFAVFGSKYHEQKLRVKMNEQIDKEYEVRFKWRMFNLLKIITERRLEERFRTDIIIKKKQKRVKEGVMDKMLTILLFSLLLKGINAKLDRKILKDAWIILTAVEYESIREVEQSLGGENEGNSAKKTSEFKANSPSFDFSSDMEEDRDQ